MKSAPGNPRILRREFTSKASAIALLSTLTPIQFAGTSLAESNVEESSPAESKQRLLKLGLNALARSPEMNYFADGHRGAALISSHYLCSDYVLDDQAQTRIAKLLDLNYASTKLCRDYPEQDPDPQAIQKIGDALAERGDTLLQVGHNAIFAMLAIKAFRLTPDLATPPRVEGVCRLIRKFTPWRDIAPDPSIEPPPFSDEVASARFILKEASGAIDRFVGFGQGFSGHMMTFGHALVELASMGDEEWAESCRQAFCKYVTVTRKGPAKDDRRIKDHASTNLRPLDAEYWQKRSDRSVGIGHVFKYPYAYYDLVSRAGDCEITREIEKKAWHVF